MKGSIWWPNNFTLQPFIEKILFLKNLFLTTMHKPEESEPLIMALPEFKNPTGLGYGQRSSCRTQPCRKSGSACCSFMSEFHEIFCKDSSIAFILHWTFVLIKRGLTVLLSKLLGECGAMVRGVQQYTFGRYINPKSYTKQAPQTR